MEMTREEKGRIEGMRRSLHKWARQTDVSTWDAAFFLDIFDRQQRVIRELEEKLTALERAQWRSV